MTRPDLRLTPKILPPHPISPTMRAELVDVFQPLLRPSLPLGDDAFLALLLQFQGEPALLHLTTPEGGHTRPLAFSLTLQPDSEGPP